MSSLMNLIGTPATSITTTTETKAVFISVTPVQLPANSPGNLIVRGCLWITTGTATTSLSVLLRVGNGTGGAQIGSTITIPALAGALSCAPYHFVDTNGPANLSQSGYSVTVIQNGATGNGTITAYTYEVDYSVL